MMGGVCRVKVGDGRWGAPRLAMPRFSAPYRVQRRLLEKIRRKKTKKNKKLTVLNHGGAVVVGLQVT